VRFNFGLGKSDCRWVAARSCPPETCAGHGVVALVRSPQHDETVAAAARIVRGSLEEADEWADELAGCDAVVHVAAMFQHFGRYDDFYRAKVRGTEALLASAERAHVNRFVYLSDDQHTPKMSAKQFCSFPRAPGP